LKNISWKYVANKKTQARAALRREQHHLDER